MGNKAGRAGRGQLYASRKEGASEGTSCSFDTEAADFKRTNANPLGDFFVTIPSQGENLTQLEKRLTACKGRSLFSLVSWKDRFDKMRQGYIQNPLVKAFNQCVSAPSKGNGAVPALPVCSSGGNSGEFQRLITDEKANRFIEDANRRDDDIL